MSWLFVPDDAQNRLVCFGPSLRFDHVSAMLNVQVGLISGRTVTLDAGSDEEVRTYTLKLTQADPTPSRRPPPLTS